MSDDNLLPLRSVSLNTNNLQDGDRTSNQFSSKYDAEEAKLVSNKIPTSLTSLTDLQTYDIKRTNNVLFNPNYQLKAPALSN